MQNRFNDKKSLSKISTFSNIDLQIILVASDMIMPSLVIEFFEALNHPCPFHHEEKDWEFSIFLFKQPRNSF